MLVKVASIICQLLAKITHSNLLIIISNYSDVIINAMASQNTSLPVVYSTVNSGRDQRKHQSSTSLAFVRGIHRSPVNSPHKGPVMRKMFPFDDVIMKTLLIMWPWQIQDADETIKSQKTAHTSCCGVSSPYLMLWSVTGCLSWVFKIL